MGACLSLTKLSSDSKILISTCLTQVLKMIVQSDHVGFGTGIGAHFATVPKTISWLCLNNRNKVAACAKHFVGDGGTTHGINENNTVIDWKGLMKIHMPAYHPSIGRGVATVMVSYSSWNGKKMHANHQLITGFLKNTLKFKVNTI